MSLPSREPWLRSMKHQATSFTLSGLVELTLVSHGPSTEPIQQPLLADPYPCSCDNMQGFDVQPPRYVQPPSQSCWETQGTVLH